MLNVVIMGKWSDDSAWNCPRCPVESVLDTVVMFVVVWCLTLWLGCLCLVLCGPGC